LRPILEGRAEVVYGFRFIGSESHRILYFWHSVGNGFLTLLSNMFTNLNLTDMGVCYKVFRKEVLDQLTLCENGFGVEPEITAKICRLRPRPAIYEVGVSYDGRREDINARPTHPTPSLNKSRGLVTKEIKPADVSVIIPAFRAADTIGRALASVAAQTCPPREVIVVDDGSGDGTADAAEVMRGTLGRIALQVIRQPNQGAGAARNSALAVATGALVAFLDADDEWLPEKLARSLPHLEDPDVVLVAHNYIRRYPNGNEQTIDCTRHVHGPSPFCTLYQRGYIGTCTVVARRQAIKAAGGFSTDLKAAQDFALWLALLKAPGTRFELFNEALSRYHLRAGSITTQTETRLDCCLDVARRYYPALRDHAKAPLAHLWFRVLAVYYEAAVVYAHRGAVGQWAWCVLRCPATLFGITADVLAESERGRRRPLEAALWLWVAAVIVTYMVQFRPYLDPIARTIGLS